MSFVPFIVIQGFKKYLRTNTLLVFLCLSILSCADPSAPDNSTLSSTTKNTPIFERILPNHSKLYFENTIKEDVASLENLFNYDYFYNGAGVGVADLNNDGLQDIFFCGNQVENQLYLNKGNLAFENTSEIANINQGKGWSNGVTFVDINNDGWLDIYISQGGPKQRAQRKNLLYINNSDGTFKEMAELYGLADMGISTQSVFFDFDNDGDLDCLVMNENELYGFDPINLYKMVAQNEESKYFNSSHLYRNDDGKFVDVTKAAGVERPIFGLGVSVSDINNDGWLDFYIASDYYIPDGLFINNHDGTFTDRVKEYTNHISFYGMGMDIADINNDNRQDIFVLDMAANDHIRSKTLMASMNTGRFDYLVNKAGFHHQYMYNSLQLNLDDNKFSNVAQATSMANTDWSWSVLMSDFDHDTDRDIYITNGYRRYALDNDLQRRVFEAKMKYKGQVPLAIKKQLYESMPSEKLPNIVYQNKGNLEFDETGKDWGLADYSFSNGAAQADFDNDGDLDLVVNNIDENCFLYKNLTVENGKGNYLKVETKGVLSESFPRITIRYQGKSQFLEARRVRGYRSSHEDIGHFGLGNVSTIDTIQVKWPSGKIEEKYNISVNTLVSFDETDAISPENPKQNSPASLFTRTQSAALGLAYDHNENIYDDFEKEVLLPYKQSSLGPFITKGDVNGDGLDDIYVGGASGQSGGLFLQQNDGKFRKLTIPVFVNDKNYEDMQSVFFDFDNDNDQDLFVVSGGNEFAEHSSLYADRLYLNDGTGQFQRADISALSVSPKSGKSVDVLDFDKDGDMDILVGNRIIPQNYPQFSASTLWENKGGELQNVTQDKAPDLENFGMVNQLIKTDFNADGWTDFIAVGEWSGLGFFTNNKGSFSLLQNQELLESKGWWFTVQETDINNDGLPDYLVGNAGLNIKFKASEKKPFKVFANDFDDNGTPDIVLSKQYNGEYVPVRGRECSSQQMPFIQQKFETYSEFANAKLVDIYGEKLNSGYEGEVNEFQSLILVNKGDGVFVKRYLPIEAQLFPTLKAIFKDLNGDGYEDAVVAGNIYETEVETPRLDAYSGVVLLSNGKDGYYTLPELKSGLLLDGNIKDLDWVESGKKSLLIAAQNDGPLIIHEQIK
ncbi:MAG: hypothetical protein ED555_07170 [Allomuricauda sp.]|nr:MAG: hypothetical protein ED555_07170 [Allomuricauda sp.]